MYQDKKQMFSEAQAVTATANSTNVIDLAKAGIDLGVGTQVRVCITVDETFTAAGAATLDITLVTDDNAALSSVATVASLPQLAKAVLTAGRDPIYFDLPASPAVAYERYLALAYTVGTGPMTAGKLTAGLVLDIQRNKSYPSNFVSA